MSVHDARPEPHHELHDHDPSMATPGAPAFGQNVVSPFGEAHTVSAFGESAQPLMQDRDHDSTSRPPHAGFFIPAVHG